MVAGCATLATRESHGCSALFGGGARCLAELRHTPTAIWIRSVYQERFRDLIGIYWDTYGIVYRVLQPLLVCVWRRRYRFLVTQTCSRLCIVIVSLTTFAATLFVCVCIFICCICIMCCCCCCWCCRWQFLRHAAEKGGGKPFGIVCRCDAGSTNLKLDELGPHAASLLFGRSQKQHASEIRKASSQGHERTYSDPELLVLGPRSHIFYASSRSRTSRLDVHKGRGASPVKRSMGLTYIT